MSGPYKESLIQDMNSLKELWKKHLSVTGMISDIKNQIRAIDKDALFFKDHTDCPTCRQELSKDHSHRIVSVGEETRASLFKSIDIFNGELKTYEGVEHSMAEVQRKEIDHRGEISLANATVLRLKKMISQVQNEKTQLAESSDITQQKDALKSSAKEGMLLRETITTLNEEGDYNVIMLELFKDSGIKSKIIDQYLPTINKLVNSYLDKLDFFVSFNLDSEFNETIKSRHRDEFTYSSFSAGQKKRIDIALLLTFRNIAKMKNSFSCNLLGLDEFADGSTDLEGINLMLYIFYYYLVGFSVREYWNNSQA